MNRATCLICAIAILLSSCSSTFNEFAASTADELCQGHSGWTYASQQRKLDHDNVWEVTAVCGDGAHLWTLVIDPPSLANNLE